MDTLIASLQAGAGFPELIDTFQLRRGIDDIFEYLVINYGEILERLSLPLLYLLQALESFLLWLPWFVVTLGFGGAAWLISRNRAVTASTMGLLLLLGVLGLWEPGMATVALMVTATFCSVLIGLPTGIAMSYSDRMERAMLPVLDIMQTLPIFVYLIPFVMLFGPGEIPALLATIVFSVPPVIRLTNLGIRGVDQEILEASISFGTTRRQRLFSVQLPLALPTIMAGINQTTMMALSMVVIASMIGAGGLGFQVLQGIQRLEVSRGLLAGLGIVFLAMIFDRVAQSYGNRLQSHLHLNR